MLSPLPEIVEMSSTNVNITLVCESGFLQGARKWMKTSEPIVFCHRTPFKCSSSTFPIVMKVLRLIEGLDWMSEWCRQCPCCSAVTPTFFFFLFLNYALWLKEMSRFSLLKCTDFKDNSKCIIWMMLWCSNMDLKQLSISVIMWLSGLNNLQCFIWCLSQ